MSAEPGGAMSKCPAPSAGLVDGAEAALLRVDMRLEFLDAGVLFGVARRVQRDIIGTALGKIGAEDVGPVASARLELDHGHGRLQTEEGQLLRRMSRRVTRDRRRAAILAGDGRDQRGVDLRGRERKRGACQEACRQERGETKNTHGIPRSMDCCGVGVVGDGHFGGKSPLYVVAVAPMTVPMVALSLT